MSQPPIPSKQRWHQNYWVQLGFLLVCIAILRSSFFNHYLVPSGSMEPTLRPGDYVAVNMTAYGISAPFSRFDLIKTGEPKPGDIAVFRSPKDGTRLIKRVVAVGGDTVELTDGHLKINGQSISVDDQEKLSDRMFSLSLDSGGGTDIAPMQIPEGKVLLLGDHRGASADGRYFGLVDVNALYGRAVAIYHRKGSWLEWTRL